MIAINYCQSEMDKESLRDYEKNQLDFCSYPDWSLNRFKEELELIIKKSVLYKTHESTGYLEFIKNIVFKLFTTVNDSETTIDRKVREEMFLKSYFVAAAAGMKDNGYYRDSLDCVTWEILTNTDKKKRADEAIDTVIAVRQYDENRRHLLRT